MLKLKMYSKSIYSYFHNQLCFEDKFKALTIYLSSLNHSQSFLKGFLKGLVDTDGSVEFRKEYPRIKFNTSSRKLMMQLRYILKDLDVACNVYTDTRLRDKPTYRVAIRTKKDNLRLAELMNSFKVKEGSGVARI